MVRKIKKKNVCESGVCDDWVCDFTKIFSAVVAVSAILFLLYLGSGAPGLTGLLKIPMSETALLTAFIGVVAIVILLLISIKPRIRSVFPFL
jgi:hypothetical protein